MTSTATISTCRNYRYDLIRSTVPGTTVENSTQPLLICGLNPSTANEIDDDNTIRKEVGFAQRWGCDLLVKVNGLAYRTKSVRVMLDAWNSGIDVKGPENDDYIRKWLQFTYSRKGVVLVAWGSGLLKYPGRQDELRKMFSRCSVPVECLGINKDGTPGHPLYVPYEKPRIPWPTL